MEFKSQSKRYLIVPIILGSLLIAAAIVFAVVWIENNDDDDDKDCPTSGPFVTPPPPDQYKSGNGKYHYAAIASDSGVCADIGNDVLARRQGNAMDATVAAMFCTGVMHPQSNGIGGGSFFVVYDVDSGWHAINSRERAPAAATSNMFAAEEDRIKSVLGGLAIGIPGEVKGLYEVHQRFGSVPWKSIVMPTVKLLENGFVLTEIVHSLLVLEVLTMENKTGFEDFLEPDLQAVKPVGSVIKRPKLAQTFRTISDDPMSFYTGSLAQDIVADIQERDGIITLDDLKNYNVTWKEPTRIDLPGNFSLYSMPPPGSGVVISYILSILAGYNFDAESLATDEDKILTYHRIVEAMKFAYGKRSALGDEDFVDVAELVKNMTSPSYGEWTRSRINDAKTQELKDYDPAFFLEEDAGTSHMCVLDGRGNAVAVTSTINTYFGSKVSGSRTGIIFNNEMDDFSTPNLTNSFGFPPSASNFIVPGKRPQSSMSPSIVWDKTAGKVRMIAGAAGGSRITSTTALLIMDVLWFRMTMPGAMDHPRIHHQLLPNHIDVEPDFSMAVQEGLRQKGHTIVEKPLMSEAHALEVLENYISAASDFRKGGQPAGY